jgi:hypothetical protein
MDMNDIKSQYDGKITSEHSSPEITSITKSAIESKVDLNIQSEFENKEEEKAAFLATARRNASLMFAKHL